MAKYFTYICIDIFGVLVLARKGYDHLDVKIVDGLYKFTPRKFRKIAEFSKIPESTLRHRINKMLSQNLLKMSINPKYQNLGLMTAIVKLDYAPEVGEELINAMKINPFALLIGRTFSEKPYIHAVYAVPIESEKFLIYYLDRMVDLDLIYKYELERVVSLRRNSLDSNYYDPETKTWSFDENELYEKFVANLNVAEAPESEVKIINRIKDDYDVIILRALEKFSDVKLTEVAAETDTTIQNLHYHYHRHILENDVIEQYINHLRIFYNLPVLHPLFQIDFEKGEYLDAFVKTLEGLYMIEYNAILLGGSRLIQFTTVQNTYLMNYMRLLEKLQADGYIKRFKHYLMQSSFEESKAMLPYDNYTESGWNYMDEVYVEKIRELKKLRRR